MVEKKKHTIHVWHIYLQLVVSNGKICQYMDGMGEGIRLEGKAWICVIARGLYTHHNEFSINGRMTISHLLMTWICFFNF